MSVFELQPCSECRQCNHIGKPSVMRGSLYCDTHNKHEKKPERAGILGRFIDRWISRHEDKKHPEMQPPTKGFRPSFFWRH
jgi:hypothetical protein